MTRVYLDHNASAPLKPAVKTAMIQAMDLAGNPSSVHGFGRTVRRAVEEARVQVAALAGVRPAQVFFTGSGTEATLLAMRIARAHTGRAKILRVATHYHGWHDAAAVGYAANHPSLPGLPQATRDDIIVVMPNDLDTLRDAIAAHSHEIAALIIEPLGSHFGIVPTADAFLKAAYELARSNGLLVIFDEVITGFRVHPGGMQAVLGLTSDLTCLAKVAAGGMPGGLVCGSAEVMSVLCNQDASGAPNPKKFLHQGTFTGNPVTAAAAVATIESIIDGNLCDKVSAQGETIRARIGGLFAQLGLPWRVYGRYSAFHILPLGDTDTQPEGPVEDWPTAMFLSRNVTALRYLRMALNLEGVDIAARGTAFVSAAHDTTHVDRLLEALERAIRRLQAEHLM